MTRSEALQVAKPILFNTEMVRAIQNGTKTVTRRALKNQDVNAYIAVLCEDEDDGSIDLICENADKTSYALYNKIPYKEGDILYVREMWAYRYCWECEQQGVADECELKSQKFKNAPFGECGCYKFRDEDDEPVDHQWHSATSMPKEAARIFLRVTGVRVERLQDIDNVGALAEGCDGRCEGPQDGALSDWQKQYNFSVEKFQTVWDSTIKKSDLDKYGWNANPWVWVIEFERLEVTE